MSEHKRLYTVEGRRNGKPVSETFRDYSLSSAVKTAKKMGIDPFSVSDWTGMIL